MTLRLIEVFLPEERREAIEELLSGRNEVLDVRMQQILGVWKRPVGGIWYGSFQESQILVKILALAEESEALLDILQKKFSGEKDFRINIVPVLASIPKEEDTLDFRARTDALIENREAKSARLSREELYANIAVAANLTKVYLILVVLSAVVAAIGLLNNNVAVIIGAMVIAPLLGPNVALSLATILGDFSLAKNALKTNFVGIVTVLAFSMAIGFFLHVNPHIPEIESRTRVGLEEVVLALVSGCAGTLAFTSGAPATLIGVAVAVALLPPLVSFGLLFGSGYISLSFGALLLFLVNIISINLAGVITFFAHGIFPQTWFEIKTARRSIAISVIILFLLLAVIFTVIFYLLNDVTS